MRNFVLDGIMGLVVGGALGVPVEFMSREKSKQNPVTDMRAYGTHHQPKGTWSDDSSMTLCLADSLANGIDYSDIIEKFYDWAENGYMTPNGEMFDIGGTTHQAILNYKKGILPKECGGKSDYDNGNGSLMRILPIAFYIKSKPQNVQLQIIHDVSILTHAHPRSLIASQTLFML